MRARSKYIEHCTPKDGQIDGRDVFIVVIHVLDEGGRGFLDIEDLEVMFRLFSS